VGFLNNEAFDEITQKHSLKKLFCEIFLVNSLLTYPLRLANREPFSFCFYSRRPDASGTEHVAILDHLQQTFTKIIDQMLAGENAVLATNLLKKETSQLINDSPNINAPEFEGIIGNSHLFLKVFDHISQVAPFDTAVLILGESGTGKGRIADCIHNLSPRKH